MSRFTKRVGGAFGKTHSLLQRKTTSRNLTILKENGNSRKGVEEELLRKQEQFSEISSTISSAIKPSGYNHAQFVKERAKLKLEISAIREKLRFI